VFELSTGEGIVKAVAESSRTDFLITDMTVLFSKGKANSFVFVALLVGVLLADNSQGIMGWFGNAGKRPNGRRSSSKVWYKQSLQDLRIFTF